MHGWHYKCLCWRPGDSSSHRSISVPARWHEVTRGALSGAESLLSACQYCRLSSRPFPLMNFPPSSTMRQRTAYTAADPEKSCWIIRSATAAKRVVYSSIYLPLRAGACRLRLTTAHHYSRRVISRQISSAAAAFFAIIPRSAIHRPAAGWPCFAGV